MGEYNGSMKTLKNPLGHFKGRSNKNIKKDYINAWLKENKQELLERNRELYKMAKLGKRGKKQGAKLANEGSSL